MRLESVVARRRKFDEQDLIDPAIITFPKKGLVSMMIGDLRIATAIFRISIFGNFGDNAGPSCVRSRAATNV